MSLGKFKSGSPAWVGVASELDNEVLVEAVLEDGWGTWLAFWSVRDKNQ